MTYLDKAAKMKPLLTREQIMKRYCPWCLGLESEMKRCEKGCTACWNREVPE